LKGSLYPDLTYYNRNRHFVGFWWQQKNIFYVPSFPSNGSLFSGIILNPFYSAAYLT
jgi:hypothetical protein